MTQPGVADVAAVVRQAWDLGCPVAGGDAALIASVAVRRWNSRHRRSVDPDDVSASINDLAKGLVQRFAPDPLYVGPLIVDYRYLARRIAAALGAAVGEVSDIAALLAADDRDWLVIVEWAPVVTADSRWAEWFESHGPQLLESDVRVDTGRGADGNIRRYQVHRRALERFRFASLE